MTSIRLDNLLRTGALKRETPRADELAGLKRSGLSRLADAQNTKLAYDSRFDLVYNAAHALALYALRRMCYRAEHRYLVFQVLPETTDLASGHWRVLAKAHEKRNLAEYEGYLNLDDRLLTDVLAATRALAGLLGEGDGR